MLSPRLAICLQRLEVIVPGFHWALSTSRGQELLAEASAAFHAAAFS